MKEREADHDQDPDVALMLAFQQGDEEAFVQLYRRYRDRIVNFARRMLGDVARSEEAAQDVFIKVYQAKKSYQPRSRFSTFIYRVATNHCLNIRARKEHQLTDRAADVTEAGQGAEQLATVERAEVRAALSKALGTLPEKQSAALVLCHYQGLSYAEAAQVLDVSDSALKSLIHRARSTLSQTLAPVMKELGHAT